MNFNPENNAKEPPTSRSPLFRRSEVVADSLRFLEGLNDHIQERLTRLETLARLAAIDLETEPSKVEEALRERVFALEAAQARLLAAQARREQEWREFLEDLEADRDRLGQAWRELERERLRMPSHAPADQLSRAAERPVTKATIERPSTAAADAPAP